jgi:RNA polymerase-binding transcription factor DksA
MDVSGQVPLDGCASDVGWFRRELERERQFRLEQLMSLSDETYSPCSMALGEVRTALMDGAKRALVEIDAALLRLSRGTFGACELCGRPIPIHRLSAIPAIRWCLSCERSQSQGQAATTSREHV